MKNYRIPTLAAIIIVACTCSLSKADEASALAVLASADASLHDQAMACDELGRVGTAKAVPVLAKLLADEKLHDYARDGLERIADPSAGKALLAALNSLQGNPRIGVITTLGDRREADAVSTLSGIAREKNSNDHTISAALTALAQIGTDKAGNAILTVLSEGSPAAKIAAGQAALLAAQHMEKDGRNAAADKLRAAVAAADVPAHIKQAAGN
jgi:hypothetical protein